MEQFDAFAVRHGIEMAARRVPDRTDGLMQGNGDHPAPVHFHIVLTMGERTLWSGEYSTGIGNAETWARKHLSDCVMIGGYDFVDQLRHPLPYGQRYIAEADYWENCRKVYARAVERQGQTYGREGRRHPVALPVADILLSLQLDAAWSDQPFSDWAADIGYSDDSISARKIWEACNDTRRQMRAIMGDAWAEFEGLEE